MLLYRSPKYTLNIPISSFIYLNLTEKMGGDINFTVTFNLVSVCLYVSLLLKQDNSQAN